MAPSLLSSNMQNGVLPLIDETLQLLSQKHPEEKTPSNNILLPDTTVQVHPIRFEEINSESIRQSELRSKGGAGPSGLDSDGWRRLLTSSAFGEEPSDLCSAMPSLQEHCVLTSNTTTRSSPRLRRLIPLNMNPGLRPIRVDETLRRIIGKAVAKVLMNEVADAVGSLQVCAGQDAGCEAAIHALLKIFEQEETEAVMLVEASNAFNSINRIAFLHNVRKICPSIATFTINCYSSSSLLYFVGGTEMSSAEGTTQGDPIAMLIYAIAVIPLIIHAVQKLHGDTTNTKAAGYADDLFSGGTIIRLRKMWDIVKDLGPEYGYYQQADKTWIIVKP